MHSACSDDCWSFPIRQPRKFMEVSTLNSSPKHLLKDASLLQMLTTTNPEPEVCPNYFIFTSDTSGSIYNFLSSHSHIFWLHALIQFKTFDNMFLLSFKQKIVDDFSIILL